MEYLFEVCKTNRVKRQQYKLIIEIPKSYQVSFGTERLSVQGTEVWNVLPFSIKSKENLQAFEGVINFQDGSKCSSNVSFDSSILLVYDMPIRVTHFCYLSIYFVFERYSNL